MEAQKQAIFPGTISIVIFSLLFFLVRNFYQEQYDTTQKELFGMENISVMHSVGTMLKHNRFINQIQPSLKNQLENSSLIPKSNIIIELQKINNPMLKDHFLSLVEKDLLIYETYEEHTSILKLLEDEKFNLADTLSLNLEPQREMAFLISITIRIIPEILKNIENLRAIGLTALQTDKKQDYNRFRLDNNINDFLENLENISQILVKIKNTDTSKLNSILENTVSELKTLQMTILNIQEGINEQTSIDYFLKLSTISDSMNNFFIITKDILVEKLQDRKHKIDFKMSMGTILYIIVIIFTLMVMFRNYYKSKKLIKEVSKKISEDNYISTLKETLLTSSSLKKVCEMSITQLVEKFGAISGILYIYDDNNYKLYLGGTYGIDPLNVDCTLCIHDNLIGDCIIDHQLKITHSELVLNNGTQKINVHELVSIPLINLDKSIGAVQLYFTERFDYGEIEFLKRVVYIMSNNIYQSEQDNQTEHYLKLIDKNIMVIKSDLNGDIIDVSEEFCNLSGFTKEELIGKNHRIFKHEDTSQLLYAELWGKIKQGLVWRGEIKNRTKDGGYYWAENIIAPNVDLNGNITGYTGIKHDITSKKLVEELSITDGLTNLFNRRYFDEIFKKKLLIAQRENKKLALAIVDIDYFKQYNDAYGHQAGDNALIAVANSIKSAMSRPNDYCFRIGGEEFAMLYNYKDENSVVEFSNRLRRSVESLKIAHSGNYSSNYITISIGIKFIKGEELKNSENSFKEADEALYEAKNAGRNRVVAV